MPLQSTADRISAYLKLREYKSLCEKKFKESMQRVNEAMSKLEAELLDDLNNAGTDSVAVKGVGTAYRITRTHASVYDRDAFLDFIKSRDMWDILDPRANKEAVKDFMQSQGEPVPGVNFTSDSTIGIRKK
jgi:hypothetical protein